jgi:hypothetical protein
MTLDEIANRVTEIRAALEVGDMSEVEERLHGLFQDLVYELHRLEYDERMELLDSLVKGD